jgi:ATP-dependent DNA ligase
MYMVFDLLELEGEDLRPNPLHERRQKLEELAGDRQLVMPVRRLPAKGLEAWDEVLRGNYEGMVAKDPASAYTPGRTLSWLKVKRRNYRQEGSARLPQRLTRQGVRHATEERSLGFADWRWVSPTTQ